MSNSSPNWSKLYDDGRCKAIGVPWSEAEAHAVYELKIPVEYVRNGCLTIEDYKDEVAQVDKQTSENGEQPLKYMKKDELRSIALDMGISISDEAGRSDLIHIITVEREKKEVAPPPSPSQK